MNILVLGGTRFFGRQLVLQLIKDGHNVTVGSRGNVIPDFLSSVNHVQVDRYDKHSLELAFAHQTFDIVYDQICFTAAQAHLTAQLFAGKCGHYCLTSTLSVYPQKAHIPESLFDPLQYPVYRLDEEIDYGEDKRRAESIIAQSGLPWSAVRIPLVMGENDASGRLLWHIDRIRQSRPIYFPNITGHLAVGHEWDLGHGLAKLAQIGPVGPINFQGSSLRLEELVKRIETLVGKHLVGTSDHQHHSPYGVTEDYTANVSKAHNLGMAFRPHHLWLDSLMERSLTQSTGHHPTNGTQA